MPTLFILQEGLAPMLASVNWTTVIVSALTLGTGLFVGTRYKNKADAAKAVMEVATALARDLKDSNQVLKSTRATLSRSEEDKQKIGKQAEYWEREAIRKEDCLQRLKAEGETIVEEVSHLSFLPTGPPTEEDESAVRRLKNIREAGKRMLTTVAECELSKNSP